MLRVNLGTSVCLKAHSSREFGEGDAVSTAACGGELNLQQMMMMSNVTMKGAKPEKGVDLELLPPRH